MLKGSDVDPALGKVGVEVLVVAVVGVVEEEDGVDDVPAQQEGLVGSDGGEDAPELGVTDEDCREEGEAVGFGLCGAREGGAVDAWDNREILVGGNRREGRNVPPAVSTYMCPGALAVVPVAFLQIYPAIALTRVSSDGGCVIPSKTDTPIHRI